MPDFIFLMHNDAPAGPRAAAWPPYLAKLQAAGVFDGGSAIGGGECLRQGDAAAALSPLGGYLRLQAKDIEAAKALLAGNPVYEAGGTVEIRELPRE